jgi:hypothetical protein
MEEARREPDLLLPELRIAASRRVARAERIVIGF